MKDISGQIFGRLMALEPTNLRYRRIILWKCHCTCGNTAFVKSTNLRNGHTQSCGCLKREKAIQTGKATRTHGHKVNRKRTRTYSTWVSMLQRCISPNNKGYKFYGRRGIRVCERWRKFENFLGDMGEKPYGLMIERINNDGNYEPGNCRWATWQEQIKNRRMPPKRTQKICNAIVDLETFLIPWRLQGAVAKPRRIG